MLWRDILIREDVNQSSIYYHLQQDVGIWEPLLNSRSGCGKSKTSDGGVFVRFTVKFLSSAKDGNPVEATVDWPWVKSNKSIYVNLMNHFKIMRWRSPSGSNITWKNLLDWPQHERIHMDLHWLICQSSSPILKAQIHQLHFQSKQSKFSFLRWCESVGIFARISLKVQRVSSWPQCNKSQVCPQCWYFQDYVEAKGFVDIRRSSCGYLSDTSFDIMISNYCWNQYLTCSCGPKKCGKTQKTFSMSNICQNKISKKWCLFYACPLSPTPNGWTSAVMYPKKFRIMEQSRTDLLWSLSICECHVLIIKQAEYMLRRKWKRLASSKLIVIEFTDKYTKSKHATRLLT